MSDYQWTPAQSARLVPGSTVVIAGKRRVVHGTWRGDVHLDGVDRLALAVSAWEYPALTPTIEDADPSTLRPPTLAWLRAMAQRKLDERFKVVACRLSTSREPVVTVALRDDCLGTFRDLPHLDARSSCALWLNALPEVTP